MLSDEQLAQNVRDAVRLLNEAVTQAHSAFLKVELNISETRIINGARQSLSVEIVKVL